MRKWHRWLSVLFGLFLLFIAATGLLSHAAALWPTEPVIVPEAQAHGDEVHEDEQPVTAAATPGAAATADEPAFTCPEGWRCRPAPPQTGPRAWVGFFHHLHSGEEFGPLGTALSILSGFALLFFAFSGLWMYVRMWSERRTRGAKDRWFWR